MAPLGFAFGTDNDLDRESAAYAVLGMLLIVLLFVLGLKICLQCLDIAIVKPPPKRPKAKVGQQVQTIYANKPIKWPPGVLEAMK
ncbi:hypothetical protein TTRE_0000670801 [Trichuris trichiura]|uniref:Uncharacterized protein n=1 Tax=Trichuris trichiura TaxID=36087 RepID=A0A077ZFQ8_TRITR|nr:hypothetical protein TTRE_0000670801 [Trichuris trichiura]